MIMDYTGERMVPALADGTTYWEHCARYRFALPYVKGQRVLDVACGEGYGSAALARSAAQVIGVDISEEACAHARRSYGLDARQGSAEALPLDSASRDLIVSFETLEHLQQPQLFLKECHRVLVPGGRLILSTPNVDIYHQRTPENPFHHHEMTLTEFQAALAEHFDQVTLWGQCLPVPAWLARRGLRRLHSLWLRCVAPHLLAAPTQLHRQQTVDWVARQPSWQDGFDPYRVQALSGQQLGRACYFIATAVRADR